MSKEILIKYLNNSCSDTELSEFFIWLNSDHSNKILMELFKSEWQALFDNPVESCFERSDLILDKIHQKINAGNHQNSVMIFDEEKLKNLTNKTTYNDESLYQILDLMKRCKLIDYKILRREKTAEGTFSKQLIVIREKK